MQKLTRGKCLLKEELKSHGRTQSWLARRTGYSRQQISNWIAGRDKMSFEAAVLISRILECKAEDLYEWELA
ncbi:helix-turn-helix transcriptional regulator [Paenibacillus sp. SEL3]|uniref:Helix-turn-helix domain-containing protein n=4 Tax=Paenibacillus TaxID=44249 RepID=A0A0D5ZBV0_PAEPS|nr:MULTISPECIES: helix-turn-helix transcriptional regulator [Paenibacillus]MBU9709939.1 helix-turn-helix transcriptional regulator [Paenibacillus sp. AK121]MCV9952317.1 helix-turn-helix transcriptional regulator [Paenibacillus sp. BT-177]AIY07243.1 helix-turn-helix domain-containing protein [Paenibacillus polymyxa]AJE53801.1 helix-turn-helix domain-containing protein [Paenibacillus polymyxa]AKA44255.1 helix-turn-helix domain-containing protein [Paenibacillus polymyxa SC2]